MQDSNGSFERLMDSDDLDGPFGAFPAPVDHDDVEHYGEDLQCAFIVIEIDSLEIMSS